MINSSACPRFSLGSREETAAKPEKGANKTQPDQPNRRACDCAASFSLTPWVVPTRQRRPGKGHGRNVTPQIWSIPGLLFPLRDSRCAPPCGRFRGAGEGRLGSMWRLLSPNSSRPLLLSRVESRGPEPSESCRRLAALSGFRLVFGAHHPGREQRASTPTPQPPPLPHTPVHHLPKDAFVCSGSRGLPGMPTPLPKVLLF